jgi:integrase
MAYRHSNLPNVYRDLKTGVYYVRTKLHNKTVWKSLGTSEYPVAKHRAPKILADLQKGRLSAYSVNKGVATFADLAEDYRQRIQTNTKLKPSSKLYRIQTIDAILRDRPTWKNKSPREIRESDCLAWGAEYVGKVHGTRFNNNVGTLRAIFEIGIENGLLANNPARSIGKVRVTGKNLRLPSSEQFTAILQNIESTRAWCADDAANLVRFLAFSGCRIAEATNVKRDDVDLENGTIRILGDAVTGTKSGESRTIPMNPALRELVSRLLEDDREPRAKKRRGQGFLLKVAECLKALANACAKVGVQKITHHDLRHLFCTRAIEAEIPIPTVAKWLGHKDGGALLMRTYSHLLDAHSKEMAARMTF